MRYVMAIALLFSVPAFAQEGMLLGSWDGGDSYSMAVYGTLKITRSKVSWGAHNEVHSKCDVAYSIEKEPVGVAFANQIEEKFTTSPDSKFKTYLLKLSTAECNAGITHLRLTFELAPNFDYLAVVEYDGLDNPIGYTHFDRRPPSQQ